MDILPVHAYYDHTTLVNNPPFITNNPVHEKIGFYKNEFDNNELDLFKSEYSKDKKENKFIGICILGAFTLLITSGVYIYKKFKKGVKKIK